MLVTLAVVPLLAAVLALLPGRLIAPAVSVACGITFLVLALALVPAGCGRLPAHRPDLGDLRFGHRILYGTTAVYSLGYLHGAHRRADLARFSRLSGLG